MPKFTKTLSSNITKSLCRIFSLKSNFLKLQKVPTSSLRPFSRLPYERLSFPTNMWKLTIVQNRRKKYYKTDIRIENTEIHQFRDGSWFKLRYRWYHKPWTIGKGGGRLPKMIIKVAIILKNIGECWKFFEKSSIVKYKLIQRKKCLPEKNLN